MNSPVHFKDDRRDHMPMDFVVDFDTAVVDLCRKMELNPLKPKQLEALNAFTSGRDTFVALSTGYGKSIIAAIMPLLFDINNAW